MTTAVVKAPGKLPHPSGDERFKSLEVTMKRHQFRSDALIEVLHAAQELFGYLEPDLLFFISRHLKLPPSKVYGVATFYHFFSFEPKKEHTCIVCTGTACHVKGADSLIQAINQFLRAQDNEMNAAGSMSLESARCLGSCGMAPAVVIDGIVNANATPDIVAQQIKDCL